MTRGRPREAPDSDDRAWGRAIAIAAVVHVILIGAFVVASWRDRSRETTRDVPVMEGLIGDAALHAMGPEPGGSLSVFCGYVFDDARGVARLSTGPRSREGYLGCRDTLSLTRDDLWTGDIEVTYEPYGAFTGVNGGSSDPDDRLVTLLLSWDLARVRQGRQWPGTPTFILRISPH
jgi:hypothetical protein